MCIEDICYILSRLYGRIQITWEEGYHLVALFEGIIFSHEDDLLLTLMIYLLRNYSIDVCLSSFH